MWLRELLPSIHFANEPGWDPIFEYMGETYAEMDTAKKNGLSHRFLALTKLKEWLKLQS